LIILLIENDRYARMLNYQPVTIGAGGLNLMQNRQL
jgi:hypothetical protein